jgi:hypothetical protein
MIQLDHQGLTQSKPYEPFTRNPAAGSKLLIFIAMKRRSIIYFVAGTLVLTGLALGYWVNQVWLLLAAFVALKVQSSVILLSTIFASRQQIPKL